MTRKSAKVVVALQAIADEMINRLLKFGILHLNPETGLRELAPAYMATATANADVDAVEEESGGGDGESGSGTSSGRSGIRVRGITPV